MAIECLTENFVNFVSIEIGNQQALTVYRDEIKNSQTDLLIFLRIESNWNGCNDHNSSKPVFHMRDDVCVLKNPKLFFTTRFL